MTCLCLSLASIGVIALVGVALKIYIKLTTRWCKSQTCLVGKTAIVTGANTGIGYETALDFAKRGGRVILACRDEARGERARTHIEEATGNKNVVLRILDLGSFKSVRDFAKKINDTEERLDILVNNAAAVEMGDKQSEDGHLLEMQINYFSPFLLTLLLIGLLKKTKSSRVVNVSSLAATLLSNFDLSKLETTFGFFVVYSYSKLCNILFTIELAKKLEGTGVTTYSLHPGSIKTEILRNIHGVRGTIFATIRNLFFKTSEEGAQTQIYCSVEKNLEEYNGEHFDGCRRVARYKNAAVPGLSKKLWELTETIVELKPEENPF